MPSPFPGMDPFVEGQRWLGFHHRVIAVLGELLVPQVRPRYAVDVGERVTIEAEGEVRPASIYPDVTVAEAADREPGGSASGAGATVVAIAPAKLTLPAPIRQREVYLTVQDLETRAVVSVLELLSPTNKRRGSTGRAEYLTKRDMVLQSGAHLVELDLLRGGTRLPTVEPLPPGDYYAFVSRGPERPQVDVYAWSLRRSLPTLPLPLKEGDPDAQLDLQAAFSLVYDRGGYDYALDYRREVEPPLTETDAAWVGEVLKAPPGTASRP